jgi:hypothetical protein
MRSPNQHPDEKPVGAAEACDLLLWIFKIKTSQPSAVPTIVMVLFRIM